jgi:hypothetical protein
MASWSPKLIAPADTAAMVKSSPVTAKTPTAIALLAAVQKIANRD